MATNSKIEWTHHTFNPWIGCTKVSDGCKHCYAEALMDKRWGKVEWGPRGERKRTSASNWKEPAKWNRQAAKAGQRARVFCASLADVMEDRPELEPWRSDLFNVIDSCPWLDFLILTKRPENIRRFWPGWYRPNVWLGTSVESQAVDGRVRDIASVADLCPVTFLSCEPLISPVDLTELPPVGWVIVGGESGHGARPCDALWIKELVKDCRASGVPVFVKQLGARPMLGDVGDPHGWPTENGPVNWETGDIRLRDSKGGDWSEWPEDLRVRELPATERTTG